MMSQMLCFWSVLSITLIASLVILQLANKAAAFGLQSPRIAANSLNSRFIHGSQSTHVHAPVHRFLISHSIHSIHSSSHCIRQCRCNSALLSAAAASYDSEGSFIETNRAQRIYQQAVTTVQRITRSNVFRYVVLPAICVLAAVHFFPSSAAAAASNYPDKPVKKFGRKKILKILKKMFISQKVTVSSGVSRAGDQIQAQTGYAMYMARVIGLLSLLGTTAAALAKARRARETRALKEAVDRELEYRENMYFDAVEEIVSKLDNPKLKGSVRADLIKQLKELDPQGKIQSFLKGESGRPDLSEQLSVNRSKQMEKKRIERRKQQQRKQRDSKRTPKQQQQQQKNNNDDEEEEELGFDDDEDDDDDDDMEEENNFTATAAAPVQRRASPSPRSSSSSSSSSSGNNSSRRKSAAPSKEPAYMEVLRELDSSLESVLSAQLREKVLLDLKARLDAIAATADSQQKLQKVLLKITQKLDDADYWVTYAQQL